MDKKSTQNFCRYGFKKKIRKVTVYVTIIEFNEDDKICLENLIQLLMILKIFFKANFTKYSVRKDTSPK